jgi:hypothetical protein
MLNSSNRRETREPGNPPSSRVVNGADRATTARSGVLSAKCRSSTRHSQAYCVVWSPGCSQIGRYVTFCDDRGERIPWLQPIDSSG